MRHPDLGFQVFFCGILFYTSVVQSQQRDIDLAKDLIETRLDIDWMLYKTVIHTNDGFSQLKKAISNWKNANILVVYKQIFEKVEEKIALQRAQEFPTLDKTPRYNEHEFLKSPKMIQESFTDNRYRNECLIRKDELQEFYQILVDVFGDSEIGKFAVIERNYAAIEKRMTKTISDLSTIQAFRDQPFEAFRNFQAKYPAEKIQNFFDTIRPIFEGKSYGVEFEYLVRTRIKKAQMTVRMPEQEFIYRLRKISPRDVHINRVLWQADQRFLKCQKRILHFRKVISTLMEIELERKNKPSETKIYSRDEIEDKYIESAKFRKQINKTVDEVFQIPKAGAGLWKSLKRYKVEKATTYTMRAEVEALMGSFYGPRIPLEEIKIPEKKDIETLPQMPDGWTGPTAELVHEALKEIDGWIKESKDQVEQILAMQQAAAPKARKIKNRIFGFFSGSSKGKGAEVLRRAQEGQEIRVPLLSHSRLTETAEVPQRAGRAQRAGKGQESGFRIWNFLSKTSTSDRHSTIKTLILLKHARNIITQLCWKIASNHRDRRLTPPMFGSWAQSVEHKFDLDYLVELDKVAKISSGFGSHPEMDLQDILIGEIGGVITHSRLKNIREWANTRIQTMSVITRELTSHLANPDNWVTGGERASSAPQPGQQNDEPGTEHGGEATSGGVRLQRSHKFKNHEPGIHYNLPDPTGYQRLQNSDYPPGSDHDYQADYGHDQPGGSSPGLNTATQYAN